MPTAALHTIWFAAVVMFLVNVPFGFWRASVRKRSPAWFAAIHVPVALAIALRWVLAIGFRAAAIPLYVVAFIAGQALGGSLYRRHAAGKDVPP